MKRVLLLALVAALMLVSAGCTLVDKGVVLIRTTQFYASWVAGEETALADALHTTVMYNGTPTANANVVTELMDVDWWMNYTTINDPESTAALNGGTATVTSTFTVMEKGVSTHTHDIQVVLEFVKVDWANWKIQSISISPDWRI